jgi:hypothetical protein
MHVNFKEGLLELLVLKKRGGRERERERRGGENGGEVAGVCEEANLK